MVRTPMFSNVLLATAEPCHRLVDPIFKAFTAPQAQTFVAKDLPWNVIDQLVVHHWAEEPTSASSGEHFARAHTLG